MMSLSTSSKKIYLVVVILLLVSFGLAGCSQNLQSQPDPGGSDGEALDEIDLSSGAKDADGDEGNGEDSSAGEPDPAMAHCPVDPMQFNLVFNHSWDFSHNRELEKFKIDGSTAGAFITCPLAVQGEKVTMYDCAFPITNTGFIQTDAGKCEINATGGGYLYFEEGSCKDGVVKIRISETVDADEALSGTWDCPKVTQPYFAYYPASWHTLTFFISAQGDTATVTGKRTEIADEMDVSGAYHYTKEWTFYTSDLPLPDSDE
jgi:hypothetical protein